MITDERQWLVANKVPAWFVDHALSTPNESMWWPTVEELEKAGIITAVARSGDFAVSGLLPGAFDRDKFEAGVLAIPTIAVIKRIDGATYKKILDAMIEGVTVGKTQPEIYSTVNPLIVELTKKYMAVASDAAVVETTAVLIAEMDMIGAKDSEACYRFANPQAGKTVAIADYISPELQQRDLKATASVIETGATNPQKIPTETDVADSIKVVFANLLKRYSVEDLSLLSNPNPTAADRARICSITSAVFNEQLAEVAELYLRKGSKVYVEGQLLRTRRWQDQEGKQRSTIEIILSEYRDKLVMLDSRRDDQ